MTSFGPGKLFEAVTQRTSSEARFPSAQRQSSIAQFPGIQTRNSRETVQAAESSPSVGSDLDSGSKFVAKNILAGLVQPISNIFHHPLEAAKSFLASAAVVGVGVLGAAACGISVAASFPAICVAMGLAGAVYGGWKLGKGIIAFKEAKDHGDREAAGAALREISGGFAISALSVMGLRCFGPMMTTASTLGKVGTLFTFEGFRGTTALAIAASQPDGPVNIFRHIARQLPPNTLAESAS